MTRESEHYVLWTALNHYSDVSERTIRKELKEALAKLDRIQEKNAKKANR